MSVTKAHDLVEGKHRTDDIKIHENVDFKGLLLSEPVLKGLSQAGYVRPSPIQLQALPLGRCGLDLIVQAKSGTGKTCVFTIIALESLMFDSTAVQVLILVPTREIAVQVSQVIMTIGCSMPKLRCYTFIGGIALSEDIDKLKLCHIAVGTPGRVTQLIKDNILHTDSIRLFILDEADKLLEEGFKDNINFIYSSLPERKQMMALSATYPEVLVELLTRYMLSPTFVRLNSNNPALIGVKQYYKIVPFHPLPHKAFDSKVEALLQVLNSLAFNQCLIFSNFQTKAQTLCDLLVTRGWPTRYIAGSQDQRQRLNTLATLQQFQCRILISTDLTARGIDAEHVNLIINMDVPWDVDTYLHRIGRAGRFGSVGIAVTIASVGKEEEKLNKIKEDMGLQLNVLPKEIDDSIWKLEEESEAQDSEQEKESNGVHTTEKQEEEECRQEEETKYEGEDTNMKDDHEILENNNQDTNCSKVNGAILKETNSTPSPMQTPDSLCLVPKVNSKVLTKLKEKQIHRQTGVDIESENSFLSDVSKQLETIKHKLLECSSECKQRIDTIRADVDAMPANVTQPARRRVRSRSRRNSRTEIPDSSSSHDEHDSGKPSVRKQKRKRSRSKPRSKSNSRPPSTLPETKIENTVVAVLSSDSDVEETVDAIIKQKVEVPELLFPKEEVNVVADISNEQVAMAVGLSFTDIVTDLSESIQNELLLEDELANEATKVVSDEVGNEFARLESAPPKCIHSLLNDIANRAEEDAYPPDVICSISQHLREQQNAFQETLIASVGKGKKTSKDTRLLKSAQENTFPPVEESCVSAHCEEISCEVDLVSKVDEISFIIASSESGCNDQLTAGKEETSVSTEKENDAEADDVKKDTAYTNESEPAQCDKEKSYDEGEIRFLDESSAEETSKPLTVPVKSHEESEEADDKVYTSTADLVMHPSNPPPEGSQPVTKTSYESNSQLDAASLTPSKVDNAFERVVPDVYAESESTAFASSSSSEAGTSDEDVASGETSSEESDLSEEEVEAENSTGPSVCSHGFNQSSDSKRDYWNHHHIGDWEAYWKSYEDWANRTQQQMKVPDQEDSAKTSGEEPSQHCSNCCPSSDLPTYQPSWNYLYSPYSPTNVPYGQACSPQQWSGYYGCQPYSSGAWLNYYWSYQQWQEHMNQTQSDSQE